MTRDGVAIARALLDRLDEGVVVRDAAELNGIFVRTAVLFGTAGVNYGSDESTC